VEDAIKLLQTEKITHSILDIDLGEIKNGFDFLAEVQNKYSNLKCMVHSNRHLDKDREKAKSMGAKMFVSKPLDIEHLAMFLAGKEPSGNEKIGVKEVFINPAMPTPDGIIEQETSSL
jgi:DNA-binding NarL/FixJ family response regulator